MMKFLPLVFALLPLCGQGLGMSPMRLEFGMNAGQTYSGALDLTNESSESIRVRGEMLDFFIDSTTTPQFQRSIPAEAAGSCKDWISVNPMESELKPSQHLLARYTLRVPATVTARTYHCAVGFTTLPLLDKAKDIGMRSAIRVVTAFYVVIGNPAADGIISGLTVEKVPNTKEPTYVAVVTLNNRGARHFRPQGTLEVLGKSESAPLATLDLPVFPVLPQREQRFVIPLDAGLVSSMGGLRAKVDMGGQAIQEATANVSAPDSSK